MPVDIEYLADYVKSIAFRVAHRYRGFVTAADLRQELALWALEHPQAATEYIEEARADDPRRLIRSLYNAAESYARAAKAAAEGYAPSDEYFYSLAQLRELLPEVLAGAPAWAEATHQPEVARRSTPASEGNGRLAMLVDVDTALAVLEAQDLGRFRLLRMKFEGGRTDAEMASWLGCSEDAARMRVMRALKWVQNNLGGARPQVDVPEVQYVGTRHTLSNAAAMAATRSATAEE